MRIGDCKYCIAVPDGENMVDVLHPETGLTVCYGKTLDDVRKEPGYEKAEIMLVDDFCAAKAKRQDSPITWTETTEERYFEMLEVLPPAMMLGGDFLVGEPWDHHAISGEPRFAAYRQRGDKFYTANRPITRFELKLERFDLVEEDKP